MGHINKTAHMIAFISSHIASKIYYDISLYTCTRLQASTFSNSTISRQLYGLYRSTLYFSSCHYSLDMNKRAWPIMRGK